MQTYQRVTVSKAIYFATKTTITKYADENGKLKCYTCTLEIKIGDKIFTKRATHAGAHSIRHYDCAERVGLI